MDESHLRSAVSYVSLNPVRARLVSHAEEWPWSSVRAHLAGEDDSLVSVRLVLGRWPTFRDLLLENCEDKLTALREAEDIGRPLGTAGFVTELERRLGRPIARRAPGRKAVAIPVVPVWSCFSPSPTMCRFSPALSVPVCPSATRNAKITNLFDMDHFSVNLFTS